MEQLRFLVICYFGLGIIASLGCLLCYLQLCKKFPKKDMIFSEISRKLLMVYFVVLLLIMFSFAFHCCILGGLSIFQIAGVTVVLGGALFLCLLFLLRKH